MLRALNLREVRLSSPSPFLGNQYGAGGPASTREPPAAAHTSFTESFAMGETPKPPPQAFASPPAHAETSKPPQTGRSATPVPQGPSTQRPDVIYRSTRDPVRRAERRRPSDPAIDVLRRSRSSDDGEGFAEAQPPSRPFSGPSPAAATLVPIGGGPPYPPAQPVPAASASEPVQPRADMQAMVPDAPPSSTREAERMGVLVTFVLQRDRAPSREELKEAARALRPLLPRVVGIAVNFHDADAPQVLGPDTLPLDGAMRAQDRIGSVYHLATFGSFVQAHREQAARVHAMIVREIGSLDLQGPDEVAPPERARVLDLFGGSGAISLAMARSGYQVTMVESFAPATDNARTAAEAQGIRLDVRTGDVAEAVSAMADAGETFDAVVMNPPRRGVSPAAREAIALIGAPLLIYVSCDPDTLARDLDHFSRLGYNASEIAPFDMIPLTEEVETVCVLRRSPPAPPRVIYEDEDILVVDKGPHEPIVQEDGEYGSSLLARCARLPTVTDNTSSSPSTASTPAPAASACWRANERARTRCGHRAHHHRAAHLPRRRQGRDARPRAPSPVICARAAAPTPRVRATAAWRSRPATPSSASSPTAGAPTRSAATSPPSATRSSATSATATCPPTATSRRSTASIDRSSTWCASRSPTRAPACGSSSSRRSPAISAPRSSAPPAARCSASSSRSTRWATSATSSIPPPLRRRGPRAARAAARCCPTPPRRAGAPPSSPATSPRRARAVPPTRARPPTSMRAPPSERLQINVPELDESPRTLRHAIVSDDED